MKIWLYPPSVSACMAWTPDVYMSPGLGGAEASVVLISREMVARGHEFRIFNSIPIRRVYDGVDYSPRASLIPSLLSIVTGKEPPPDVFIFYRAYDEETASLFRMYCPDIKLVGWSTDQYTESDYVQWFRDMDKVVTISDFHADYLHTHYAAPRAKLVTIDLPVNVEDYTPFNGFPRGNRFLWASQAERGLNIVINNWLDIREAIPDATLTITADHRLWGVPYTGNDPYRAILSDYPGVNFCGAVHRKRLVEIQKQSSLLIGPLTYEELFCVSVAEAQAAGCIPITSTLGALPTTNFGGNLIQGDPSTEEFERKWVAAIVALSGGDSDEMGARRYLMNEKAIRRFAPSRVAEQWEEVLA